MKWILGGMAAVTFCLMAQTATAAEGGGDTILVLDVSNSMWGQIEGRAKIEIAREAVGGILDHWDAARPLGVMAYGHRRPGDCGDIELVAPVGSADPKALKGKVNALVPRGKTPLTESVRRAAEELSFRDRPATVILVSDGIESCNADPCAVAAALEKSGIAFTAHVIGFALKPEEQKQLRCIADATGGKFFTAANAGELKQALERAAVEKPAAPKGMPPMVRFQALDGPKGKPLTGGVRWQLTRVDEETAAPELPEEPSPALTLPAGRYRVEAQFGAATGSHEFEVTPGKPQLISVEIPPPPAKLQALSEVAAGSDFQVHWEGPNRPLDYVTVVQKGAEEGSYINYAYTEQGNPLTLRAPMTAGEFELRYTNEHASRTLASIPLRVTPVQAVVHGPAEVAVGQAFEVTWEGPNREHDYVTIVRQGAPEGSYLSYDYTAAGNPLTLIAPHEPGDYELRYANEEGGETLARVAIAVTATTAALEAPAEVAVGSDFQVRWSGPDRTHDYITIVPKGAPPENYASYQYTSEGNPVTLTAPVEPGEYEVRYNNEEGKTVLATAPVRVTGVQASLEAPGEVVAGSEFEVHWNGPAYSHDYVTIAQPDAAEGDYFLSYFDVSDGNPGRLTAPDEPGRYELRYVMGSGPRVIARVAIEVVGR
ncbi:MAG: VWA domain-containing protein [Gammaproteobacteria bacterium]